MRKENRLAPPKTKKKGAGKQPAAPPKAPACVPPSEVAKRQAEFGSGEKLTSVKPCAVNLIIKVRMLFMLPAAGSGRVFNPKIDRPRWGTLDSHPVTNGIVTLKGTNLVGVLDKAGQVTLDVTAVRSGDYTLDLHPMPDHDSPAPAGPAHSFPIDVRFQTRHRPLSVKIKLEVGDVATVKAASIDETFLHGAVAFAGNTIIIDWKPDWIAAKDMATRKQRTRSVAVVVHRTGAGDMNSLNEGLYRYGAHYYLDVDGHAVKLYNDAANAPHAAPAYWKGEKSINSVAVGIETVNESGPFPDAQIDRLKQLLKDILAHEKLDRHAVVGHADVATEDGSWRLSKADRVVDPGPEFPWKALADDKLTSWSYPHASADAAVDADYGGYFRAHPTGVVPAGIKDAALIEAAKRPYGVIAGVQRDLSRIGYSIHTDGVTVTGILDAATTIALDRFRRHYMDRVVKNDWLNGPLDRDTALAIKRVLVDRNELAIPPPPPPPPPKPPPPASPPKQKSTKKKRR